MEESRLSTVLRKALNSLTLEGQKETGFLCGFQGKQKGLLVPIFSHANACVPYAYVLG